MPIRHIRSVLVSLLAFCLGAQPSPARAAKPVVEFESTGKVCLSEAQQAIVLKKLTTTKAGALILVGYSDISEIRGGMRVERCLTRRIPEEIRGHERIAVARALHVYEIANRAGIPGFDVPPVFHVSLGDNTVSGDTSMVAIMAKRSMTGDEYARRVDLIITQPPSSQPAPPTQVHQTVIEGPRVDLDAVTNEMARARARTPQLVRVFAWAELGVGVAVSILGGAFLISGAIQHRSAEDTIDSERRPLLEADGYQYIRAGGWASAIGAGLIIGGIATFAIASRLKRGGSAKAQRGPLHKLRATVGLDSKGFVLRW